MSGQGSFVPTEDFYPRPPRGGRLNAFSSPWTPWEFLSTPSARRATTPSPPTSGRLCYFYPRPPRGGRRAVHRPLRGREDISIHALREEGDPNSSGSSWKRQISIHALREEGDRKHWANRVKQRNFYPRPPRGGRHVGQSVSRFTSGISIHALREEGDPKPDHEWPGIHVISIHALREEGDQVQGALDREPEKFLSTPSARRATLRSVRQDVRNDISIHALREEGDAPLCSGLECLYQFLSTPSARRATRTTTATS